MPSDIPQAPARPRLPAPFIRMALALTLVMILLLLADALCYRVTLPVALTTAQGATTLRVGSLRLPLGQIGQPQALLFTPRDPLVHEYQIDDSDSANNFTLDTAYLRTIANTPYYRFQSWMRDLAGLSVWRDLQIQANGRVIRAEPSPAFGELAPLPQSGAVTITAQWQRPETVTQLTLYTTTGSYLITLDRNDRYIQVVNQADFSGAPIARAFFPTDGAPFAAIVIDFLLRTFIWALLALWLVVTGEIIIALVSAAFFAYRKSNPKREPSAPTKEGDHGGSPLRMFHSFAIPSSQPSRPNLFLRDLRDLASRPSRSNPRFRDHPWILRALRVQSRLTQAIHPIGLLALLGSFAFVTWIALVQYRALPHIYDAGAYLFGAKILASGQLSVPIPPAVDRFPGPFMVQHAGRWFTQYAPGTSLTLAAGVLLGVPWLVEPVLGTLALLGIGLIARRLFDRRVATLAVILGALSPFYSYLAASYLSHAIALCYLVWGWYCFLRFAQDDDAPGWLLPLAAALLGMAGLTRDLVALLFAAIVIPGTLALTWPRLQTEWRRWLLPGAWFSAVALAFFVIYLGFNAQQTGDAFVTPRSLFFAGDRWGFGQGVGFYGQHTLAAGFVTVDELLTSLAIDLFGWPFYLTLAFLAIPFLTWRATKADWLLLAGAALMTGAFLGYYYHGIYLGPRYLFETLPFLLILTARGIFILAERALKAGRIIAHWRFGGVSGAAAPPAPRVSAMTIALVAALLAANLLYFLPRQIALHRDFSGGPAWYHVATAALLRPPAHHAIVVTGDFMLYDYTLFALNDPALRGDVLYAFANAPDQFQELRAAYPGRALYQLTVDPNTGKVSYTLIPAP